MLPVPGGVAGQRRTAMHLRGVTFVVSPLRCPSSWGGEGCSATAPPAVSPDGPSGMLSSPDSLQTSKITRSAVCKSSPAPDEKRVVRGVLFYRRWGPDFSGAV